MSKQSPEARRAERFRERAYDQSTGSFIGDPAELRPLELAEGAFRHSHWKDRRELVFATLKSAGTGQRTIDRFECCGCFARVVWSPSQGVHRVRASYCRNRHCEPCMRAKANLIAKNVQARLDQRAQGRYRFITLTLKHSKTPLPQQIKRLFKSFTKLRKSAIYAGQVGGTAVLEVKTGKDRKWHPHLHVITEGGWIAKQDLSAAWLKITGDSYVTDIRAISNCEDVAYELTKYITKSTDMSVWRSPDRAIEWVIAMRGTRCCATYGTWRTWRLTQKPKDPKDWVTVCTITELIAAAAKRERWAMAIVDELRPPGLSDIVWHRSPDSS